MAQSTASVRSARLNVLDSIWRFFTSVRIALWMIGLIALCTFVGTLVPQAAQAGLLDDVAYQNWLVFQTGKFGQLVWTMDKLALFHIFQSFYFRLLLALLTLSIILCTINRVPGIWRNAMHRPPVKVGDKLFTVHPTAQQVEQADAADPAAAVTAAQQVLSGRRYRVLTEVDGDRTYLYADKNRFGIFGTFVSHLGLVLCLLGAMIGNIFGWRDDVFTITDGSTREIGRGTNLAVRNDLFIDEYDVETGQPSDFYTDAVLLERRNTEWVERRQHRIRVNDPLVEGDIVVHQAFFGPAAVLTIKDNQGNILFSDGIPMPYRNPDGRPIGWVDIPAGRFPIPLSVFVVGRAPVGPMGDPQIKPGQVIVEVYPAGRATEETLLFFNTLDVGRTTTVLAPNGRTILELTFERERQFTGLNLSYNPGLPLIWLACLLMLVGWSAVFYWPHRRLRALVRRTESGAIQVATAYISKYDLGTRQEGTRLLTEIERRLKTAQPVSTVLVGD